MAAALTFTEQNGKYVAEHVSEGLFTVQIKRSVPMIAQALYVGLRVTYFATVSNTGGGPTIKVNGLGAKLVTRGARASSGIALQAGDILAGLPADILYNGSTWILMNPQQT